MVKWIDIYVISKQIKSPSGSKNYILVGVERVLFSEGYNSISSEISNIAEKIKTWSLTIYIKT